MVFQGTVRAPSPWNAFHAHARLPLHPIRMFEFLQISLADDLNAWRMFEAGTTHETMVTAMNKCQCELYKWGSANQVSFDKDKECLSCTGNAHVVNTSICWDFSSTAN